jgi:hypothetical protein
MRSIIINRSGKIKIIAQLDEEAAVAEDLQVLDSKRLRG